MSTSTNTELLKFFKWWLQEAQSTAPYYKVTQVGLCSLVPSTLCTNFKYILESTTNTSEFPFGGAYQYSEDNAEASMHLNPERIAFVKSQIERLEKLNETI